MKKLLLGAFALAAFGISAKAQTWSENFNGGIPATWTLFNVDGLTPHTSVSRFNKAWNAYNVSSGDSCIVSTSYYTPAGAANDWITSPSFTVPANAFLTWDEYAFDPSYPDGYEVRLSTGGNTPADFTVVLYSTTAANSTDFTKKLASLTAYNGQTVRIAFRNNSNDMYLLALDNVEVTNSMPATELQLVSASPNAGHPLAYGKTGSSINLTGTVKNNGHNTINSYTINYQQGSNAVVSATISTPVAPFETKNISIPSPFSIAAANTYPIKVWVTAAGDSNNGNDTSNTTITGVDAALWPVKKIVFEEGTGTWCQWCPRGAVFMDSLRKLTVGATQIAVHNSSSDPMRVTAYDNFVSSNIGGYPSMLADRRLEIDPSEMIDLYNEQKDYFGFANMSIAPTATASSVTVPVTIKPAVDLSGDFRLVLVVTEDHVKGTTSGYAQANAYSNYANMSVNGVNFKNLPNPVPASQMEYNFTARSVTPSPTGTANMLPASMTKGNTYNYTFSNVPLESSWTAGNLRYNVMLINGANGVVMNSASTVWGLDVKDLGETLDNVSLFPNPASADAYLTFNVKTASDIQINVVNQMGQVSKVIMTSTKLSGAQKVQISTTDLAAGNYLVNIVTAEGINSQKLTVVK